MISNVFVSIVFLIVITFWLSSVYIVFFGVEEKAMKIYLNTAIALAFIIAGMMIFALI